MLKVLLWFVYTLLAFDAGLIAVFLANLAITPLITAPISDLGLFLAAAGVLVAFLAFLVNWSRARSDDILKTATDLLEKAYETLASKDGSIEPTNRRLSWLSAARLIATAEKLEKDITDSNHLLVYAAKKEYWRTRLSELIYPLPPGGLPSTFYAEEPEHMADFFSDGDRPPLSEKSIAFLHRFISWPEEIRDPIGEASNFTDEEIEKMMAFGPRGLGELLAKVRELNQQRRGKNAQ